ncbi:hypothetical protein GJ496_000604 [Pomphorhynchus laevis]|nr:hypothetical protein GJ496_000604 [Pomphorhynchus laevis]
MDDSTPLSRFSGVDPHIFNVASKSIAHCSLSRHTVVDVPCGRTTRYRYHSDTAGDLLRVVSSGLNRVVEQPNGRSGHVQSGENTECYLDPAMFRQRKRACQARCAVCSRLIASTTGGLLRKHGPDLGCPESSKPAANGALPTNEIGPAEYTTDISEAVDHINDCGEDDV